jgi:hypothetical protein
LFSLSEKHRPGLLVVLAGPVKGQYTFTTIDAPGADYTAAHRINNGGQIAGYYGAADGYDHGFLREVDGIYTRLDVPGAIHTYAALPCPAAALTIATMPASQTVHSNVTGRRDHLDRHNPFRSGDYNARHSIRSGHG